MNPCALGSSRARGQIDVFAPARLSGKLETVVCYPDKMSIAIESGPTKLRQVLVGEEGWVVQNGKTFGAPPQALQSLKVGLFHNINNLWRFLANPANLPYISVQPHNGTSTIVIIRPGNADRISKIDCDDELTMRSVSYCSCDSSGQLIQNRIEYDGFHERNSIRYPAKVRSYQNDQLISEVRHDDYETDIELGPSLFQKV
ncbi:MAG: hypothetical protein LAO78_26565 [Acidobacteriia bacterium]|nr:hypothetical protein [Terriglobia bacterium]